MEPTDVSGKWRKVVEDQKRDGEEMTGVSLLRRDLKMLKQFSPKKTKPEDEKIKLLEESNNELLKEKEDLRKELEEVQKRLSSLAEDREQLEQRMNEKDALIQQLTNEIKELKYTLNKESLNSSHYQFLLSDAEDEIRTTNDTLQKLQEENTVWKQKLESLERENLKEKESHQEAEEKSRFIQRNLERAQKESYTHLETVKKLSTENDGYKERLLEARKEVSILKNEKISLEKEKRLLHQQTQLMNKKVDGLVKHVNALHEDNSNMKKELELAKEDVKSYKAEVNVLKRKCEVLSKKLYTEEQSKEKNFKLLKIYEQGKDNLYEEVIKSHKEIECLEKSVLQLENEKSFHLKEITELQEKISLLEKQWKIREDIPIVQRKQVSSIETEKATRLQKTIYNQAIKDSSKYKRGFIESQVDLQEQKDTINLLNHHIELLKQEISEQNTCLTCEQKEIKKKNQEIDVLKTKCQNKRQEITDVENKLKDQEIVRAQLLQKLSSIQDQVDALKKDVKMITTEKQLLSTQLIKKNETISFLEDKVKLLEIIISRGKTEYNAKLHDINLLKLEIRHLSRELTLHSSNKKTLKELKSELVQVKKESLKKDVYNKALTELIRTPTNIHKWRIIESTEPDKFGLIQKVCALQKSVVEKTCKIDDLKNEVQQKEVTIKRHKMHIRPFSAAITTRDIQMYRKQLNQKTNLIKNLSAERNMFYSMASELKEKVDNLTQDLYHMRRTASAPLQRSKRVMEDDEHIQEM